MYTLGVDLGTTSTAAAVARPSRTGPWQVELVGLGTHDLTVPTAVSWTRDGEVLVGEPAARRLVSAPHTVAREFKRLLGSPVPVYLDGVPHPPADLMARVLRWVVDRVAEREGSPPGAVGLTCPASWQGHRRQLLLQAARDAGVGTADIVSEPEAAALRYASLERLDPGAVLGVYDLGGGTFDAAVVRRDPDGFRLLAAGGLDHVGGLDIDDLVVRHVLASLSSQAPNEDDLEDPNVADAVALLRRDCVEAKEALSDDTETVVPVRLPEVRTRVRLTRGELEEMVRPLLDRTVSALRETLDDARVRPESLTAVLLAGGASRMPLVVHVLTQALGRPLLVDAHPKHVVAAGAALRVADPGAVLRAAPTEAVGPLTPSRPLVVGEATQVLDLSPAPLPPSPAPPSPPPPPTAVVAAVEPPGRTEEYRTRRRPGSLAVAGVLAAVAAVVGGTWAVGAARGPSAPVLRPTTTTATSPAPATATSPTRKSPTASRTTSTTSAPPVLPSTTRPRPTPTPTPSDSPTLTPSPTESPSPTITVSPPSPSEPPTPTTSPEPVG